jgi:hypothetical protein
MNRIILSGMLLILTQLAYAGDVPFITNGSLQKYDREPRAVGSSPSITGRVLWNAVPVKGALIELKKHGNYYTEPVLAQAVVDANGRFIIDSPPAGNYMIYAISPSDEYWEWTGSPITIHANKNVDAGTFYLRKKLQLLEPTSGATLSTTTPTLRWSSFPDATRYHVDIFDLQTNQAVLRQDTVITSLVVAPALAPGIRYQWTVNAYNAANIEIAYYSAWEFLVLP